MKSRHKEDWNRFLTRNYSKLLRVAERWTDDPGDLVHHVYLRCIDKRYMENPFGYFVKAMYFEATRGKFKELYKTNDNEPQEQTSETDWSKAIQRERMQLLLDRLSWFDRTVFSLYLQGWNMAEISRRSGIGESPLYRSIHLPSKTPKEVLPNLTTKT